MRKNRFTSALFIIAGLLLFMFACQEEKLTDENLTSNCGQVDLQALSSIGGSTDTYTVLIRLFSGGYDKQTYSQCPLGVCYESHEYTSKKTTFENNLKVDVKFDITETESKSVVFSGSQSFTVNKADASEKTLELYTFPEEFPFLQHFYKITQINVTYLDECPTSTNEKTIAGAEVLETENTDAEVIVRIGTLESKTASSFNITGNLVITDATNLSEYGVIYANSNTADYVQSTGSIGNFGGEVTGLESNTTYIVRAYAILDGHTYYSKDYIEVTTNAVVSPTVTVGDDIKDVTATSVTVGGNSVTDGDPASAEFGVAYSLTNNTADIVNHISSAGSASGYEVTISELSANTNYYVWAYAKQNGVYVYSASPVQVTTSAAISTVIFNGVTYRIDGGDYMSYTSAGISYMAISMHRFNGEVQDFNVSIELHSNDGFKSGTYTFGTGSLNFDNNTVVALDNTQNFMKATGGTVTLTINENKDYTVEMDVQTEGGALTGTYTVLAEFGSEL